MSEKQQILFVDDERRVFEALERMLFMMEDRWQMAFVDSGAAALDYMEHTPVDVLVSDMRMPQMDGATLLTQVKERWPSVVRIVLSGHAELETALRAVPVAHQFLNKPCEADVLEEVISRACALRKLLDSEELQSAVGQLNSLPPRPAAYTELLAVLADANANFNDLAAVVEKDMAMIAKVLQVVNSSFFGLPRKVSGIKQAISYLGIQMLKNLVLTAEVFKPRKLDPALNAYSLEEEELHALAVGRLASTMFSEKRDKEDAFLAGVLHDVGVLALADSRPAHVAKAMAYASDNGTSFEAAEVEIFGFTHAEVGAYLLGIWGLPYAVIEATAHHHHPARVPTKRFCILAGVHISDCLLREVRRDSRFQGTELDLRWLENLASEEQLALWRETAAQYVV